MALAQDTRGAHATPQDVLDYERTSFAGGAPEGADRPTENSIQTRLQLSF